MPRNRMIKPEFWTSETLIRVSIASRLTFIGIWNFSDDYGVSLDSNRQILGNIFPLEDKITERNVEGWKQELLNQKLLLNISYNSKLYLYVNGWEEHQQVPNKSKRRWIPEETLENLITVSRESNESVISHSLESNSPKNKEQRTKNKEQNGHLHDLFEVWWINYQKKTGKQETLAYWLKMSEADRALAIDHTPLFVGSKPDKQFRPDPIRYLRNRIFEDEIINSSKPDGPREYTQDERYLQMQGKLPIEKVYMPTD